MPEPTAKPQAHDIEAKIREAIMKDRQALTQSIKAMRQSALQELGVVSAACRDKPARWSHSELATDLEPIVASAILARGQDTQATGRRTGAESRAPRRC
jgi:hypothetical protein